MKLNTKDLATKPLRRVRSNVNPARSLRSPVTVGNRELLRWLRAAELSAWQETKPRRAFRLRLSRFNCGPLFRLNIAKA
jgi:hypothetical protein